MAEQLPMNSANAGSDVVLKVDHVAKSFRLPTEQASGLKQAIINWTKGIKGYKTQQVLRDINFEVHRGDFFGIVGRNGSGKSTLLKLISKIYVPDSGSITVNGKLVPFIELGVGFNPELTGRENVYLNGALLGFTHEEIDAMYDDIVEFAELEDFMDQKLKNYSSGMQVRLAFSVAIKAQGDVLVLDEVLAVGDEAFQRKCDNFFTQIKKDPTKTVILVTHDMGAVKKYCNKAILIKDGEIIVSGDKEEVANQYTLENTKVNLVQSGERQGLSEQVPYIKIIPHSPMIVTPEDSFEFTVEFETTKVDDYYLSVSLTDTRHGVIVYETSDRAYPMESKSGKQSLTLRLPLNLFNNCDFRVRAAVHVPDPDNPERTIMIAFTNDENAYVFYTRDPQYGDGPLINDVSFPIVTVTSSNAENIDAD
ncbi:ABC transporter ATP-binding protein [Bifidobacterium leontopitheci]|uniref:Sugar ABC transporter n=1 Tax=Bifidobacterium leontopitheci TaxID=2650774 RepID=A0A6I1GI40_9BIFI|nr:ABC transporter ATP-binding protein [Bifidobacterium leontopitheci]KAB7790332.1 sugar ABC transporter [Bifidobacterium leontopitheci]